MKRAIADRAVACLAVLCAAAALADDAVGVRRYRSAAGEDVGFLLPFAPLVRGCADGFLAGAFSGDGEEGADALAHFPQGATNDVSYAVRCAGTWLDSECGVPAPVDAAAGDGFILSPGECGPLDFFAFGRLPWAVPAGTPWVSGMRVADDGSAVELGVDGGAAPVDLLATSPTGAWEHLGRFPATPGGFDWRDAGARAVLQAADGRDYLLADASRDTDGDGVPDHMETCVYGTSPLLADTDGDGLADGQELAWGSDPLTPGGGTGPSLSEGFELPEVAPGAIAGQNGWIATEPGMGVVVTGGVHRGAGALSFGHEHGDGRVAHAVESDSGEIWLESWLKVSHGGGDMWFDDADSVSFTVDDDGHPVVSDGAGSAVNRGVVIPEGRWTRVDLRLDYVHRSWDCYVDGIIAFSGLALRGGRGSMAEVSVSGSDGAVDDILVTDRRPAGLSSDGDLLPDEWEFAHFGSLERDGSGDADGDGAPDIVEFRAGSDPLLPDSDFDGYSDGHELAWGMDPLAPCGASFSFRFFEGFERPAVEPGDLDGQNGWSAGGAAGAVVREDVRRSGSAALRMTGSDDASPAEVGRPLPDGADEIWLEFSVRDAVGEAPGGTGWPDGGCMEFFFDDDGHPVLSDGDSYQTNASVTAGSDWTRVTVRLDYGGRTWDCYVDGVRVGRSLAMRGSAAGERGMLFSGDESAVDDVCVSTERPEGLSADDDPLPDEWEISRLWTLDLDGFGDSDGDGLTDYEELLSGTDPLRADTDGDGLPDQWEVDNGTDPFAEDSAADPDGDGLDNAEEFRRGTHPLLADTDGDGIPDGAELRIGTNAKVADALADPDMDGLSNIDEWRAGTDIHRADTDGDGATDGVEVRNVHGDPLAADILWGSPVSVSEPVSASAATRVTGMWRTDDDGGIYAVERAGSLTWTLAVPAEGADALALRICQHEFFARSYDFDLSLFVDGLFVSRQVVTAPYGRLTEVYFFLPEIMSGEHEFRLVWHNWELNTFLGVRDLRFVRFGGPDADGNGTPDWRDARNSRSSGFDVLPYESLVSPLCVEGHDLWRDVLEVAAEYPDTNATYAVVKTIGDGFYADVPLSGSGVTRISMSDRSLSNAFDVVWRDFDVFAGEFVTNALAIRTGDALKIACCEGRESAVVISNFTAAGVARPFTNWTQTASSPCRFDEPGLYLVRVSSPAPLFGTDEAYAWVEVVKSRFPIRNPVIMQDRNYVLDCPELAPRNLLERDEGLAVAVTNRAGGGLALTLSTPYDRDLGLVSRLDEDGAISDAIQVTPVWADNGTYYHVTQTYPDGSQLVEVSLLLGAIRPDMSVKLSIFVSGVTFEDGTRNKTLTADDFDENGHCLIRFIKARGVTTSVCHRTYIYQNGKLVFNN